VVSSKPIADADCRDEADRWVNRIVDAHTPSTDRRNRMPYFSSIDFGNKSGARRFYPKRFRD
jgi:hypothetical protein